MKYVCIGAHPDDPDLYMGATAMKLIAMGHEVKFIAMCNGDAGHQSMAREALKTRRYGESRAAAKLIGLSEYEVFDTHDCNVQADLATREKLIRSLRRFAPDVVVSPWLHDYHADHRAAAQVTQDAAFLLNVPLYCDDTPIPSSYPVFAYCWHPFTDPRPFRPDAAVECDSLYDEKCRILDCHASQFYEWLPWSQGRRDFDASNMTWEQKREHLGHWMERFRIAAEGARQVLIETYGDDGRTIRYAETFELTQYGRQVPISDFRRLMAGLKPLTDEVVQLD